MQEQGFIVPAYPGTLRYRGRQENRVTPFVAVARNLCSQLGDLGNCCHKVVPGKEHHETYVSRELEEEKGSLLVQGGGEGEAHLALPGGRRGKMVGALLICTTLYGAHPRLSFHPSSQAV